MCGGQRTLCGFLVLNSSCQASYTQLLYLLSHLFCSPFLFSPPLLTPLLPFPVLSPPLSCLLFSPPLSSSLLLPPLPFYFLSCLPLPTYFEAEAPVALVALELLLLPPPLRSSDFAIMHHYTHASTSKLAKTLNLGNGYWFFSSHFQCSTSCKKKETYRLVKCTDGQNIQVNESFCDPLRKPLSIKKCRNPLCKYMVVTGDSSQVRCH